MKIRIKFAKTGVMKFVGHLDVMRYFQKAIRRAELPIAYSEGFSPHMLLWFLEGFPRGHTGFHLRTHELGAWAASAPGDGLPAYLLARRYVSDGRFEDAAAVEGLRLLAQAEQVASAPPLAAGIHLDPDEPAPRERIRFVGVFGPGMRLPSDVVPEFTVLRAGRRLDRIPATPGDVSGTWVADYDFGAGGIVGTGKDQVHLLVVANSDKGLCGGRHAIERRR